MSDEQTTKAINPKVPNVVKKALLIGINYIGTANQLNGCINDTTNLKNFLVNNKYYNESDLTMMNDTLKGDLYPNRQNILKQMNNLVTFAQANPTKTVLLFLQFSGHGINVRDTNGDESDGYDEAIVPVDYDKAGLIVDDDIRANLLNKLTSNVKLTVLCDSCHSGTILDLKYNYFDGSKPYTTEVKITETVCDVVSISGCRDNQTSADTTISGTGQGAMTGAFIKNYKDEISYKNLISGMRTWLAQGRYTQVPQLCSGKLINVDSPFLLSVYNN